MKKIRSNLLALSLAACCGTLAYGLAYMHAPDAMRRVVIGLTCGTAMMVLIVLTARVDIVEVTADRTQFNSHILPVSAGTLVLMVLASVAVLENIGSPPTWTSPALFFACTCIDYGLVLVLKYTLRRHMTRKRLLKEMDAMGGV